MNTTIPTPQDKRLLLQDTVTKTASFDSAAVDLGAGYAPGGPGQRVAGIVAVVARDVSSGNETYAFALQESDDSATFAACGTATAVAANGVALVRAVVTKRFVRLSMSAGGTTPSITYKAWLNPLP
ncbi:MAG TPA: hypothetical protein VF796_31160 [Humisphaera sp.]